MPIFSCFIYRPPFPILFCLNPSFPKNLFWCLVKNLCKYLCTTWFLCDELNLQQFKLKCIPKACYNAMHNKLLIALMNTNVNFAPSTQPTKAENSECSFISPSLSALSNKGCQFYLSAKSISFSQPHGYKIISSYHQLISSQLLQPHSLPMNLTLHCHQGWWGRWVVRGAFPK